MLVKTGDAVEVRQPLFLVHAETPGELDYAMEYLSAVRGVVSLEREVVET